MESTQNTSTTLVVNRFRIYTGPTLVNAVAAHLGTAYARVMAGTEHVYVNTYTSADDVLECIRAKFTGFTHRDVQFLGSDSVENLVAREQF